MFYVNWYLLITQSDYVEINERTESVEYDQQNKQIKDQGYSRSGAVEKLRNFISYP